MSWPLTFLHLPGQVAWMAPKSGFSFVRFCFVFTCTIFCVTVVWVFIMCLQFDFPKQKFRFPGHQISWVSDWVIDWLLDFSPQASSAMGSLKEIWHKGSLGDEDDAWTWNTRIVQRNCAISHLTMEKWKMWRPLHSTTTNRTSVLVTALCNKPKDFVSDLGDDQSHYLWFKAGFCTSKVIGWDDCPANDL